MTNDDIFFSLYFLQNYYIFYLCSSEVKLSKAVMFCISGPGFDNKYNANTCFETQQT